MNTEVKDLPCHNLNESEEDEDEEVYSPHWILEDFEIGDCLGNGKFGYVYKAVEKKSKVEVAIKVICKKIVSQYNLFEQLKNEVEIHTRLL
jgi:serine/threonine protein kinase